MPIPVSTFWYQADVPAAVRTCMDSWHAPPGLEATAFTLATARRFFDDHGLTRARAAFEVCGPFAMASDYLRLHLMVTRGGLYVDANWAQVQPVLPLIEQMQAEGYRGLLAEITEISRGFNDPMTDFMLAEGGEALLNGFIFTDAPRDPFLVLCAEIATRNIEARSCEQIAFAAGSGIMSALLMLRNYGTRARYVEVLREMGGHLFTGKSVANAIETVIAVTGAQDHGALRDRFSRIKLMPGPEFQAYAARKGLGQTHKDHWMRHQGSLYRDI